MLASMSPSSRFPTSSKREGMQRASDMTQRGAAADQMMHAWSMDALRSTVAGTTLVGTKKEECPPEVYLG